jgi:hypothetical protein
MKLGIPVFIGVLPENKNLSFVPFTQSQNVNINNMCIVGNLAHG